MLYCICILGGHSANPRDLLQMRGNITIQNLQFLQRKVWLLLSYNFQGVITFGGGGGGGHNFRGTKDISITTLKI